MGRRESLRKAGVWIERMIFVDYISQAYEYAGEVRSIELSNMWTKGNAPEYREHVVITYLDGKRKMVNVTDTDLPLIAKKIADKIPGKEQGKMENQNEEVGIY